MATQKEMVKEALDSGINPKSNKEIAEFIQAKHGVEMTPQAVATVKTALSKEANKSALMPNPLFNAEEGTPIKTTPAAPITTAAPTDALALIREVRALANKCGGVANLKVLLDELK